MIKIVARATLPLALLLAGCGEHEHPQSPVDKGFAHVSVPSLDGTRKLELCFSNQVNHGLLDNGLRLTFADAKELGRKSVAKPGEERLAVVFVYSNEMQKMQTIAFASREHQEIKIQGFRVFVPSAGPRRLLAVQENGLVVVSLYPSRRESPQRTLETQMGPLLQFVERSVEQCKRESFMT